MLKMRYVAIAGLLMGGSAFAQQGPDFMDHLEPRKVAKQERLAQRPAMSNPRLVVKFSDTARVRADVSGVKSQADAHLADVEDVVEEYGFSFEPVFKDVPQARLTALQNRAAQASGKAQPDLGGFLYATVRDEARLTEAGRALLKTGAVRSITWDYPVTHHGPGSGLAPAAQGPISPEMALAMSRGGGTEDFTEEQDYQDFMAGGYDINELWDRGQLILDKNWHVPEWEGGNGARGASVRVGVIDFAAWLDHEDLNDVTQEPGTEMAPPGIDPAIFGGYNHGAACLGIIGATDNDFGMTGNAPEAELWFFPSIEFNLSGRLPQAFINAYTHFERGDVVSVSLGRGPVPLYFVEPEATLMQVGKDLGITTFVSAGNSCNDLSDDELPESITGDLPCVCVGAGFTEFRVDTPAFDGTTPFVPYARLGFTNHFTDYDGVALDEAEFLVKCQSWGVEVASLGYGDLFVPNGGAEFKDYNRSYTTTFGGTSAACPLVASLAASLQGLSKMYHGIPLSPASIQSLVADNTIPQELAPGPEIVSHSPEPGDMPPGDGNPCTVNDNVQLDDDGEIIDESEIIGGFTNVAPMLTAFFTTNWFDTDSDVLDIEVISGEHQSGTINSLGIIDGAGIEILSEFRDPSDQPQVGEFPEVQYVFFGHVTDLGLELRALDTDSTILMMNPMWSAGTLAGAPFGFLRGVDAYNHQLNRWEFLDVAFMPFGVFTEEIEVPSPGRFINPSNEVILMRHWMFGFGSGFGFEPIVGLYDWFEIDFTAGGVDGGG